MIAPRKLQSLGEFVQADAAAVSSVRSTSKVVVVNNGIRLKVAGSARGTARGWLNEFEDALRV
jgi:hypothetical protein